MIWVFLAGAMAGALAGAVIMGLCAARQDEARVRELERLTRFCDECAHWDRGSCSEGYVILMNPDEIVIVPMCADFARREEAQ